MAAFVCVRGHTRPSKPGFGGKGGRSCPACKKIRYRLLREKVFSGYGGRCKCCGESRYEFPTLDHVAGDGYLLRRRGKNDSWRVFHEAINEGFPPRFQVLCWNCNTAREYHGVCPHALEVN